MEFKEFRKFNNLLLESYQKERELFQKDISVWLYQPKNA